MPGSFVLPHGGDIFRAFPHIQEMLKSKLQTLEKAIGWIVIYMSIQSFHGTLTKI